MGYIKWTKPKMNSSHVSPQVSIYINTLKVWGLYLCYLVFQRERESLASIPVESIPPSSHAKI